MVFIDCSKFACAISSKQAQIESYIGENEDITTTAFIYAVTALFYHKHKIVTLEPPFSCTIVSILVHNTLFVPLRGHRSTDLSPESKVFYRHVERRLQLVVEVVPPENVLVDFNLRQLYAFLDRNETELVGSLREASELFFVVDFIHERCDRIYHLRDCAEPVAEAVWGQKIYLSVFFFYNFESPPTRPPIGKKTRPNPFLCDRNRPANPKPDTHYSAIASMFVYKKSNASSDPTMFWATDANARAPSCFRIGESAEIVRLRYLRNK